jgi:hypothetical protein
MDDTSSESNDDAKELTFEEAIKRKRKFDTVFAINEADMSLDKLIQTKSGRF